jgi:PAS domain S-box-containing protein
MNKLLEQQIQKYLTNINDYERSWLTPFFEAIGGTYEVSELDRESMRRFKIALDSAGDFVMILDKNFNITYANASLRAHTGFTLLEEQTAEKTWWSKVAPATLATIKSDLLSSPNNQNQFVYEFQANTVTGDEFPVQIQATTVRDKDGGFQFILIIGRDVTLERKADQQKNEFISIASHELRTPMTVIKGYSDILLKGRFGPINDDQRRYLTKISDNTQSLISLVGDILSISKLEAGKMSFNPSPQSVNSLLEQSRDKFKELYEQKNVTLMHDLTGSVDLMVQADPDRFDQIMNNLLSNSLKFTNAGGVVKITSSIYNRDSSLVIISVQDSGIGIPQDKMGVLFRKFSQVDNVLQRQAGGTGLGLALCKEIVEGMHGQIWAVSQEGKGTNMLFTLPIASSQSQPVHDTMVTSDN